MLVRWWGVYVCMQVCVCIKLVRESSGRGAGVDEENGKEKEETLGGGSGRGGRGRPIKHESREIKKEAEVRRGKGGRPVRQGKRCGCEKGGTQIRGSDGGEAARNKPKKTQKARNREAR